MSASPDGRTILLAGGTSAGGRAAATHLLVRGAQVVVAGRDPVRLEALAADLPGIVTAEVDLADESAVAALAATLHGQGRRIDGILHLVGGWRGGGGLAGQTEADYRALEASLTALRHVSRVFDDDLRRSPAGRLAIVSSTAVSRPLAGGANYAAVKAASEAWTRAVAQGYAKAARDAGEPLRAAAVAFRVKSLAGLEDRLASAFGDLFETDAAAVNDTIVELAAT